MHVYSSLFCNTILKIDIIVLASRLTYLNNTNKIFLYVCMGGGESTKSKTAGKNNEEKQKTFLHACSQLKRYWNISFHFIVLFFIFTYL